MAKRKKKPEKEEKTEAPKETGRPEEFDDAQYIIDYVKTSKKVADDACKERRTKWEELWLLYQNKQNYTDKKSWQSKVFTPKIFTHTLRGSGLVERAVLQTSTLFKVDIDEEAYEEKEFEKVREKARKVERKIKAHLDKTNFADSYGVGTVSVFLLGLGDVKRLWDEEDRKCSYENVDVLNLSIDPAYIPFVHKRPGYIIERKEEKLCDLLKKYRANKENYREDAIEKLEAKKEATQEIRQKQRARRGISDYSPQDKPIEILEFWGDIVSKDGKDVLENQLVMVANDELIRFHENPFKDKLPPHRLTVAIPYPHRGIAGTSLVEGAVPLQYTLNNLLNLYFDNLNFTVNKMYEMNKTGLVDPQKAKQVYPGKIFLKSTNERIIQEVKSEFIGAEIINAIKVTDSELRQATAVTEYVEALPSKHKQTLGEIEKKTAESHGFFDVIARRLERNSIALLIKDTYNLLLQFSNILEGLEGEYIFKVGGLSLMLQEEKLRNEMAVILKGALESETLGPMTDIAKLWKKILTQSHLQEVFVEPQQQQEGEMTPQTAVQKAKQDFRGLPPQGQMRLLRTVAPGTMPAA